MERVLQLRDLVLDHLHARRLLHDLRAGAQERRPDRDLDRLAADLRADPVRRLLDVRARLRLSRRRAASTTGRSSSAAPGWGWFTGWFNLIGLVAVVASVVYVCGDLPDEPARPLQRPLHLQLRQGRGRDRRPLQRARQLRAVRVHPDRRRPDQRLLAATSSSVSQQLLGVVERARRGGDRGDPDRRALSHHASLSYVFGHRANESGFSGGRSRANSGSTCCRSASC